MTSDEASDVLFEHLKPCENNFLQTSTLLRMSVKNISFTHIHVIACVSAFLLLGFFLVFFTREDPGLLNFELLTNSFYACD